jgi:phosphatidylserine/phosphatidylglycerophosphate/cardiolipin synthase-like enzyme
MSAKHCQVTALVDKAKAGDNTNQPLFICQDLPFRLEQIGTNCWLHVRIVVPFSATPDFRLFMITRYVRLIVLLIVLVAISLAPACASDQISVVQSIPVETDLAVPGLRETSSVWTEMIAGAKHSIDLEQFYVYSRPATALSPVLDAIRAAAARGVKVRLLIDAGFYRNYSSDPDQLDQVPNIQVRTSDFSPVGGIQHAKYFVVDDTDSFVGSANFDWVALTHVHEVGLRIHDSIVAQNLEKIFALDWTKGKPLSQTADVKSVVVAPSTVHENSHSNKQHFYVVASPPKDLPDDIPTTLPAITALCSDAKKLLRVQVYEFNTKDKQSSARWTVLTRALRKAAAGGAHVQVLVDTNALTVGESDLETLAALNNIEVRVVHIPQWSGGAIPYSRLVHSKYAIDDDRLAWVGSENYSCTYFTSSRNVGIITPDPDVISALSKIFDKLWSSPYVTTLAASSK